MLVMVDEPTNGLYYGSAVAAPVVSEVFTEILPYLGYYAEYTEEELAELEVTVPDVEDADVSSAKATLESLGLNAEVIGNGGTVINQMPSHGSEMPKGCTVILYTEEDYEEKEVMCPISPLHSRGGKRDSCRAGAQPKTSWRRGSKGGRGVLGSHEL